MNYAKKRYLGYAFIGLALVLVPFITINSHHLFLLSFDRKELHLFFTKFDMQELYLMPFLLIALFLSVFFITTLAGRVWCGWVCPQTLFRVIFRDLIQTKLLKIRKNTANKQQICDGNLIKKAVSIVIFACFSLLVASNFMWYFVPPEDFFVYLSNPSEHSVMIGFVACVGAFLTFDIVFLRERFCVYICPYARIQSVMFDDDTIQVIYDENRGGKIYENGVKIAKKPQGENDECIGCESCVKICPTGIDIRKGMQLECINCLECADACEKTMAKFNKKSLISWTSKNSIITNLGVKYLRFRTAAYVVMICFVLIALVFMSQTKENMLLNINRMSELYSINFENSDIRIDNAYTFLFQNTDDKAHSYFFDVNDSKISINRPTKPIYLESGAKRKVIVVLSTDQIFVKNYRKDTPFNIEIYAYATDKKDEISVKRKTIFVYPRYDIIEAKQKK